MNYQDSENSVAKTTFSMFWKEFLVFSVALGAIFFFVSTFLPVEYEADSSILIIQKNTDGLDAYREVKSAEFAGKIVSQIILSNSFMNGITAQNSAAKNYIQSQNSFEDKVKEWQKMVNISQSANSGILNISVFAPNKEDAKKIQETILNLLGNQGDKYFGNDKIGIKVINEPFYLDRPAFPNVFISALAGFLLGILIVVFLIATLPKKFFFFLRNLFRKF